MGGTTSAGAGGLDKINYFTLSDLEREQKKSGKLHTRVPFFWRGSLYVRIQYDGTVKARARAGAQSRPTLPLPSNLGRAQRLVM